VSCVLYSIQGDHVALVGTSGRIAPVLGALPGPVDLGQTYFTFGAIRTTAVEIRLAHLVQLGGYVKRELSDGHVSANNGGGDVVPSWHGGSSCGIGVSDLEVAKSVQLFHELRECLAQRFLRE